jgi:hypothetical protein
MRRAIFAGIWGFLAAEAAMAIVRASSDAGFFSQPGSFGYLLYLLLTLAVYMTFTAWLGAKPQSQFLPFPQVVLIAGATAGMLEVGAIVVENFLPALKLVPFAVELSIFLSWAGVGALVSRRERSVRSGVLTAVASAAFYAVIGVCGGELAEFFVHPAAASEVAKWAEFQRSHWTDAASFQIANTMDSATTHLTMAPLVALILGSVGATVALVGRKTNKAR